MHAIWLFPEDKKFSYSLKKQSEHAFTQAIIFIIK